MVPSENEGSQPYLKSKEITEKAAQQLKKEIPFRSQEMGVGRCSACPAALQKWTKAELVKKLIEVYPLAQAIALGGKS